MKLFELLKGDRFKLTADDSPIFVLDYFEKGECGKAVVHLQQGLDKHLFSPFAPVVRIKENH